jgi:predicted nuclease with TOPRIM domain
MIIIVRRRIDEIMYISAKLNKSYSAYWGKKIMNNELSLKNKLDKLENEMNSFEKELLKSSCPFEQNYLFNQITKRWYEFHSIEKQLFSLLGEK